MKEFRLPYMKDWRAKDMAKLRVRMGVMATCAQRLVTVSLGVPYIHTVPHRNGDTPYRIVGKAYIAYSSALGDFALRCSADDREMTRILQRVELCLVRHRASVVGEAKQARFLRLALLWNAGRYGRQAFT